MNGPPPFTLYILLVKHILGVNLVTEINIYHAVVVVISDTEAKKFEVGDIVFNLVPNSLYLSNPLDFLK